MNLNLTGISGIFLENYPMPWSRRTTLPCCGKKRDQAQLAPKDTIFMYEARFKDVHFNVNTLVEDE